MSEGGEPKIIKFAEILRAQVLKYAEILKGLMLKNAEILNQKPIRCFLKTGVYEIFFTLPREKNFSPWERKISLVGEKKFNSLRG